MEWLLKKAEEFFKRHKYLSRWRKALAIMMAMVVFTTTYAMILPAITLETDESDGIGLFTETPEYESVSDNSVEIVPTEPPAEPPSEIPEDDSGPAYLDNEALVFENENLCLSLTVPAEARVSKDAQLDVREIGQPFEGDGLDEKGREEEYLAYLAAAEEALLLSEEEITYIEKSILNAPAADVPWFRFFVLSIINKEGIISPACPIPVQITYKNTAKTAADGLKVMCLGTDGKMGLAGSETAVTSAGEKETDLIEAEEDAFDVTVEFTDAGTLAFGTFAVDQEEIGAAIEAEKVEAAEESVEEVEFLPQTLEAKGPDYTVTMTCPAEAKVPEGAVLTAEEILADDTAYEGYVNDAAAALDVPEKETSRVRARFFDIRIMVEGEEFEPAAPVRVEISYEKPQELAEAEKVSAVHFAEEGEKPEVVEIADVTTDEETDEVNGVSFDADSFSVYGVVYTVDFEWEVDGKTYEFTMAGGGSVTLSALVNALKVTEGDVSAFVENIQSAVFSDESLIWAGKAEKQTTVAALAEENALEIQYSAEKTEAEIAEINARTVEAGDWVLISLKPFDSEESLLVTMIDGQQFTVKVTDANGSVTIHYVDRSGNPITTAAYNGTNTSVTALGNGVFTIPFNTSANVDLKNDFSADNYTYANSHLGGKDASGNVLTYNGLVINAVLKPYNSDLRISTDKGETNTNSQNNYENGNYKYGNLQDFDLSKDIKARPAVNGSWITYAASGNKEIYVVLDPVTENSSGSQTGELPTPENPTLEKTLTSNNDGTYTLSLKVDAHAESFTSANRANVLFIVDTSSSMRKSTGSSTRIKDTHDAIRSLGSTLLSYNTSDDPTAVEVAMITFDGGVQKPLDWTTDSTSFTSTVDSKLQYYYLHTGTDWEDGLKSGLNKVLTGTDSDPTFVVFFTDGEPSQYTSFHGAARYSGGGYGQDPETEDPGTSYRNYYSYFLSREASKDEMRAIVNAGARLYGIYAYNTTNENYGGEDGAAMLHNAVKYGYNTSNDLTDKLFFEATNTTGLNKAFDAILNSIRRIVGFSNVVVNDGISTSVTSSTVVNGDVSGFTYVVHDENGAVAYEVTVSADGTPTFRLGSGSTTYTGTKKNIQTTKVVTDTNGNPVRDSNGKIQTETVTVEAYYYKHTDNVEYIMPIASTGANVSWDLSPLGILKDGYSYEVKFVVWPNQSAYDLVAKLNNGIKDGITENWSGLTEYTDKNGKKYQIGGIQGYSYIARYEDDTYAAMSNTDQTMVYYNVDKKIVNSQETVVYEGPSTVAVDPPDPMKLVDSTIKVQKSWNTGLDDFQRIRFLYNVDGNGNPVSSKQKTVNIDVIQDNDTAHPYITAAVGWETGELLEDTVLHTTGGAYNWIEEKEIAAGLMLSQGRVNDLRLNVTGYTKIFYGDTYYYVLEEGHNYTLQEVDSDYHFDFITDTYHPMVVDGHIKMVTFTKDPATGKITGIESWSDQNILTGTNSLRARLRVQKVIKDADGDTVTPDPDIDITLTVRFNDAEGNAVKYTDYPPNSDGDKKYKVDRYGHYLNAAGEIVSDSSQAVCVSYNDYPLWYYIYDKNGNSATSDGEALLFEDGETITFKSTEYIQIINIPLGYSYAFSENTATLPAGMEFSQVQKVLSLSDATHPPVYVVSGDALTAEMVAANTAGTAIYNLDDGTHTMSGAPLPNNESQLTFVNLISGFETIIRKMDADVQNALGGVEFKLYKAIVDSDTGVWTKGEQVGGTYTTASQTAAATSSTSATTQGEISLGTLPVGYYLLEETKTAAGFILPEKPIKITVTAKGVTYEQEGNSKSADGTGVGKNGFVYTLLVTNSAGIELPATGGPGAAVFYLAGMILVLAAGSIILMKKKAY